MMIALNILYIIVILMIMMYFIPWFICDVMKLRPMMSIGKIIVKKMKLYEL